MATVGSSVMTEVPWYEKRRVRDLVQFFSLLPTDNMAAAGNGVNESLRPVACSAWNQSGIVVKETAKLGQGQGRSRTSTDTTFSGLNGSLADDCSYSFSKLSSTNGFNGQAVNTPLTGNRLSNGGEDEVRPATVPSYVRISASVLGYSAYKPSTLRSPPSSTLQNKPSTVCSPPSSTLQNKPPTVCSPPSLAPQNKSATVCSLPSSAAQNKLTTCSLTPLDPPSHLLDGDVVIYEQQQPVPVVGAEEKREAVNGTCDVTARGDDINTESLVDGLPNGHTSSTDDLDSTGEQEKDGHYYLRLLDEEKCSLDRLCALAEQDLASPDLPEEVTGRLRAAIGKATLLTTSKFKQCRELCQLNIHHQAGKPRTLASDLEGYWELVSSQLRSVHEMFTDIERLRVNHWIDNDPPTPSPPPQPASTPTVRKSAGKKTVASRIKVTRPQRPAMSVDNNGSDDIPVVIHTTPRKKPWHKDPVATATLSNDNISDDTEKLLADDSIVTHADSVDTA